MPTPTGRIPREVAEAFERGLFALPERPSGLGVSAAPQSVWRIPVVLADFQDDTLTHSAAEFDSALFGTRNAIPGGSVRDYYRWASGGRIDVTGRVVAKVRLSHTLDYYGAGSYGLSGLHTNSVYGAVREALVMVEQDFDVDWSEFDAQADGKVDMLWFLHSGKGGESSADELQLYGPILGKRRLWSITSQFTRDPSGSSTFLTNQRLPWNASQFFSIDRFSSVPELSGVVPGNRCEIGVFCHEFGHALLLPDLYDTQGVTPNVGPGNWSLMSTGNWGGNGFQPESPSHLGGWAAQFLQWNEKIRPSHDTTLVLTPVSEGGPVVELWFQGESNPEHFLLENRTRSVFDKSLLEPGLIVTHVDDQVISALNFPVNRVNTGFGPTYGLLLVEGDGDGDLLAGRNRADRNDPLPGALFRTSFGDETTPNTRTFRGAVTNISLDGITRVNGRRNAQGDSLYDIRLNLAVRAPGWLAPQDHTDAEFKPLTSTSAGNPAVLCSDGTLDAVASEIRNLRPQVVLHRRTGGSWSPGVEISASPAAALNPAIAAMPSGDAVVVWSDIRGGRWRIWVRVRLQGVWGAERVLGDLPGENRSPAIGADAHGRVYVAWLNIQDGVERIYFTRFVYFAPFGQPIPITPITSPLLRPGNPAMAVDEDGISYILWSDLADNPHRLWFTRFHPDSGLAASQTLTDPSGDETAVCAMVDTAGTVHVVWHSSTSGRSEVHYQRRFKTRRPAPRDTVVASSEAGVANPRLAIDPSGTLHLVYESTVSNAQQIYYKRWRPNLGWDFAGTEITSVLDGSADSPIVLPESPGNVSVIYKGNLGGTVRFMERRRQLDSPAPPPEPLRALIPAAPASLRPNPLHAGQEFELDWDGPPPAPGAAAELFDLAGRLVSVAPLEPRGTAWRARFSPAHTARLTGGIYFLRVRAAGAAAHRLVILR